MINEKSGIVWLVHFTTEEYFNSIHASKFPSCGQEMGYLRLTCLSFDVLKDFVHFPDPLSRYPLLEYTLYYWNQHLLHCQEARRTFTFHDDVSFRIFQLLKRGRGGRLSRLAARMQPLPGQCAGSRGEVLIVQRTFTAADLNEDAAS